MSKNQKLSMDIPFPISDLKMLVQQKYFTLLYPLESKLGRYVDVRMNVRLLGMDDEEYFLWMSGQGPSPRPQICAYYDITYTRDCTLDQVQEVEWETAYDAVDLEDFLSHEPKDDNGLMGPDSYVRIVCLSKHSFSLKELNRKYGRNYQRNRRG